MIAKTDQLGSPSDPVAVAEQSESLTHIHKVFSACADSTRLRILHVLAEGEICVGNLVSVLQLPQPTVSRHLAYLRKAALVSVRKDGLWSHYSLAPSQSCFQSKLYECFTKCLSEVPELKQDLQRVRLLRQFGGCCCD